MLKFIQIIAVLATFIAGPLLAEVTVVITDPQNGAEFEQYTPFPVSIIATNTQGTIIEMRLYLDSYLTGRDYTAPYMIMCSNSLCCLWNMC